MTRVFHDRTEAGRALGRCLESLRGHDVVVLGLPRGGVPVAFEVAAHLDAPLDVIVVRKVGVPGQSELAMGAIGEDGVSVVNDDVVAVVGATEADFERVEARERAELERRAARFRGHGTRTSLVGRTAVIVDDGIATGSTARAACQVARAHGAERIVLAVPVASPESVTSLSDAADDIVCVEQPYWLQAVGQFYDDFTQVDDDVVVDLLDRARRTPASEHRPRTEQAVGIDTEVAVDAGALVLPGHLTVPVGGCGVVIFAHGSGSSRHSPRNQYVAERLNHAGLGTLTFDLLTESEAKDRRNVFDIELLATRLTRTASWIHDELAEDLPIALFGASTGAAAALVAADGPPVPIAAVVSRGGRPDLAGDHLGRVTAPTLLIVGGDDTSVLELNRRAQRQLRCEHRLSVVPGATHLFEEPGTLDAAATLAADWFLEHCERPDVA